MHTVVDTGPSTCLRVNVHKDYSADCLGARLFGHTAENQSNTGIVP